MSRSSDGDRVVPAGSAPVRRRGARGGLLAGLLGVLALTAQAGGQGHAAAHVHGLVPLEIVVEPGVVTIGMEAPLDSLLGFERAPRSAAEKQAAQALLQALRSGQGLFAFDPAAGCLLQGASATSEALEPPAGAARTVEHADVDARFEFRCTTTQALRAVDVGGLLDRYSRIRQIEAGIVAPQGQFKRTLARGAARQLTWGR
ncbi:uncharacterized protein DUF2796 [Sphaerotilus hippei]|uniref:Uncharacterized protein DUF2796 n=1 Tax=Sphaerotilus hippei TaxID=744406 RepID=A0A318HCZ3_9BURK|nr:DUF2796 domain-containing protein [Sphaerotilus hippei]PXW98845.1 uncharacterized protein DUF2796 [Sphaerotilus hippei]